DRPGGRPVKEHPPAPRRDPRGGLGRDRLARDRRDELRHGRAGPHGDADRRGGGVPANDPVVPQRGRRRAVRPHLGDGDPQPDHGLPRRAGGRLGGGTAHTAGPQARGAGENPARGGGPPGRRPRPPCNGGPGPRGRGGGGGGGGWWGTPSPIFSPPTPTSSPCRSTTAASAS